jgi:hypothetical protein
MASQYADEKVRAGAPPPDPYLSSTRWRHEESSSFRRHATPTPREADARHGSKDLTDFLKTQRADAGEIAGYGKGGHQPLMVAGNVGVGSQVQTSHAQDTGTGTVGSDSNGKLEVKCGPLLNYRRMENETWFGSVLVVTKFGGSGESPVTPQLTIKIAGPRSKTNDQNPTSHENNAHGGQGVNGVTKGVDYGSFNTPSNPQAQSNGASNTNGAGAGGSSSWKANVSGTMLYSDPSNTFWRFDLQVPMQQEEIQCEYSLSGLTFTRQGKGDKQHFYIPAITESMRIMFHSCNGFSVGTDEDAYSGACLWNDVGRVHAKTPFHVM